MVKIVLTEPAEYDLLDIEYTIHVHLCNPQASIRITNGIIDKIRSLEDFPESHQYVDDDLLKKIGLRMTWFDNYNIFYFYDEAVEIVHIIRILYDKADWKNILKK